MATAGPKEKRLAELRATGKVPKHAEMMLADGAPLAAVTLPGDPPRTYADPPRTVASHPPVDKPSTSPTSKPTPATSGTTSSEDAMKTATAKKTPKPRTAAKTTERRKPKSTAARTPVAKDAKPKQPKGMVVEILKLASRTNGVSRAELIALTKWQGAPWKWLFKNKKGTGYCDRWGYSLKVIEGKDGETRYHVEKK